MKTATAILCVISLLIVQALAVSALTSGEARDAWNDANEARKDLQKVHEDAKIAYASSKTAENEARVVSTGKDVLHALLNETEAWLTYKNLEVKETEGFDDLEATIDADVEKNMAVIESLRTEVDGVNNTIQLGLVYLKMVGKYIDLIVDVARNTGSLWSQVADTKADEMEGYESKLREAAGNHTEALLRLDNAKAELATARTNIEQAKTAYSMVKLPGTPLLKFSEGNNNLRTARVNLINAHGQISQAYLLIARG